MVEYNSKILDEFIDSVSEYSEPNFSLVLSEELCQLNPDERWPVDEFIRAACSESWQTDEINEFDHIALKHLFYRIIVPKEHWDDCTFEKFVSLTKQRYMEQRCED